MQGCVNGGQDHKLHRLELELFKIGDNYIDSMTLVDFDEE